MTHAVFYYDLGNPECYLVAEQIGAALTEPATMAGWKNLPSWYMVSERDNALPPDAQRFMANRAEAVTESVDGSHAAYIARPDVAAGLILKALATA